MALKISCILFLLNIIENNITLLKKTVKLTAKEECLKAFV